MLEDDHSDGSNSAGVSVALTRTITDVCAKRCLRVRDVTRYYSTRRITRVREMQSSGGDSSSMSLSN